MNSFQTAPQLSNLWEFYILDAENLKFKVINTSLPFPKLEQEKKPTGEHFYSGYTTPDTFSVTFREDVKFSIHDYFLNWQKMVFDFKSGVFKSGVKQTKEAIIEFSSFRGGEEVATKTFYCHGLRVLGVSDLTLDYTNGDQLQFTVNFGVDVVTPDSLSTT